MRRRQLILLHTGLGLAAVLLGWRLVAEWRHANQLRYAAAARPRVPSATALGVSSLSQTPTATGEIVAQNLFFPDRNSELVQPAKPKTAPPLPVVFGTLNLGQHYEALMAEAATGAPGGSRAFRRVKTGERLGDYIIVEIRDNQVVIEFEGEKTTLDVYQSANSVPRPSSSAREAAAPVVQTAGSTPPQSSPSSQPPPQSAPPATSSESATGAQPDPYTRVTIEGNRRKVERQTPFGTQVWYEEIR